MTTSRAHDLLTRRGDRRLLTELVMRGRSGELVTTALALLPHARTVSAQQWEGDEETRPLSRVGVREALELVDLLSSYGVRRAMATSRAGNERMGQYWRELPVFLRPQDDVHEVLAGFHRHARRLWNNG